MNYLTTSALGIKRQRIFFLFLAMLIGSPILAQDFPARPQSLVYDETNFLTAEEISRLNGKLLGYEDSTSTQIAIAILNSTQGYDIDDFKVRLAENWGIGQDKKDNGVLILVIPSQRKMAIASGYGTEARLTDAESHRIIFTVLQPNFREDKRYEGLDLAINWIIGALSGEFEIEQTQESVSVWSLLLLFLIFLVVMYFISKISKGGGGRYYDPDRHTYMGPYRGSSTWTDFSGGGGSFGGGSSGGFGGFGGGSFGGGGASGSW